MYIRLYLELNYHMRGIISSRRCRERQEYEYSEDEEYMQSSIDSLRSDLEKVVSLMQRSGNSSLQVGRCTISKDTFNHSNDQKFCFEYTGDRFLVTENSPLFNSFERYNEETTVRSMKKDILKFFTEGLNFE